MGEVSPTDKREKLRVASQQSFARKSFNHSSNFAKGCSQIIAQGHSKVDI